MSKHIEEIEEAHKSGFWLGVTTGAMIMSLVFLLIIFQLNLGSNLRVIEHDTSPALQWEIEQIRYDIDMIQIEMLKQEVEQQR